MSFIMRPIRFASTGHIIEGSGLFDGSSGFLSKTFGSTTAAQARTFTLEFVFKLNTIAGTLNTDMVTLISCGNTANDSDTTMVALSHNFTGAAGNLDTIHFTHRTGAGSLLDSSLVGLFRDPAAFYHVVLQVDTTPATPTIKWWVNGTAFEPSITNNVAQNTQFDLFQDTYAHRIGRPTNSTQGANFSDMYLSRITACTSATLTATDFGEVTDDGFWQINDVSELTFGNNGFLIEGGTDMAAGTDSSGNSNNF